MKNKTDFKRKVKKITNSMLEKMILGRLCEDTGLLYPKTANVFVLSLPYFMAHATKHYKVDKAATEERLLATVNDKIRFAGILALHYNCDNQAWKGEGH